MENYISINLIYIRKVNYLNQQEFAKIFKISRDIVSALETNKKKLLDISLLQEISSYFEISLDDLINTDLSKTKILEKQYAPEPQTPLKQPENTPKMTTATNDMVERLLEEKDNSIKLRDYTIDLLKSTIEQKDKVINQQEVLLNQNQQQNDFDSVREIMRLIIEQDLKAANEKLTQQSKLK